MPPTPPTRVLLVDDHEMFAQSLVRVLADTPSIDVVAAVTTIDAAVQVVAARQVDVAVFDYALGDGDGITGTRRVQAASPGTTVLLLSGTADEQVIVRALEAGCSGFVSKERAITELVAAISAVAAGDAWVDPALLTKLLPLLQPGRRGVGSDLTRREVEVLRLAAGGLANAAIAGELHLSVNTVRNHMQNAITKLSAHSKLEAVAIAVREGLISYPSG